MYIVNIATLHMIAPQGVTRLAGHDMESGHQSIDNAWIRVDGDKIAAYGSM